MRYFFVILSFLFSAPFVYAGSGQDKILGIIRNITNFLGSIFLSVGIVIFLYAGYRYWQAQGKPEDVAKAHQNLLWACIGLAVGLLAFSADSIISSFLLSS